MKKTIAVIMAVLMLFGCVTVASVYAQGTAAIEVNGQNYYASVGSTVTYKVELKAPEIIENGQFTVFYPKNALAVNSVSIPNVMSYQLNYKENVENEVKFNFSSTEGYDFTTQKTLVEVKFDVIDGTPGDTISLEKEVMCNLQDIQIINQSTFVESLEGASLEPIQPVETSEPTSAPTDPPTNPSESEPQETNPTEIADPSNPGETEPATIDPTENPTENPNSDTSGEVSTDKALKLSADSKSLKAGKTFKLSAVNAAAGETVKFKSSKKSVAKVTKSGKITALKKGTAKITVTAGDRSAVCTVKVTSSPKLSSKSITVKVKKTKSVKITGKASSVRNEYFNSNKARITSGTNATTLKVKGLKKGKTTLYVTVNGVTLSLKVNVKK